MKYSRTDSFDIRKLLLYILLFAIVVIPNLSMTMQHVYDSVESSLFNGDVVYDFHLKVKSLSIGVLGLVISVLLFIDLIRKRLSFNYKIFLFSLFSVIVLLSAFLSPFQEIVWDGAYQYYESTITFIGYFMLMYAAYITSKHVKDSGKLIRKAIFVSFLLVLVQSVFQYIGINVFNIPGINQFTGLLINASHISYTTDASNGILAGLDNSNFLGSFIVIPIAISLCSLHNSPKRSMYFMYYASFWMLLASNSAAGAIGIVVLIVMYSLLKKVNKKRFIEFFVPLIALMCLNPLLNMLFDKPNIIDKNQYAIIIVGLFLALVIQIYHMINKKMLKYSLVALLVIGAIIMTPIALSITEDGDNNRTFDSYEATSSSLSISKDGYSLEVSVDDNGINISELPSGKNVEFYEGTMIFDNTDNFKSFSGDYQIFGDEIALRIYPVDLVLLVKANQMFYQDMYGWREVTNLSSSDGIGFSNHQKFASSRGYIWSRTLPLLKDRILIGEGPDTFMFVYPQEDFVGKLNAGFSQFMIVDKPHNFFLRYWVQFGFIALALFMGGVAWISYEGLRKNKAVPWIIALLAILGTGMFNDIIAGISFLIYILIGLIIGELEKPEPKKYKKA